MMSVTIPLQQLSITNVPGNRQMELKFKLLRMSFSTRTGLWAVDPVQIGYTYQPCVIRSEVVSTMSVSSHLECLLGSEYRCEHTQDPLRRIQELITGTTLEGGLLIKWCSLTCYMSTMNQQYVYSSQWTYDLFLSTIDLLIFYLIFLHHLFIASMDRRNHYRELNPFDVNTTMWVISKIDVKKGEPFL